MSMTRLLNATSIRSGWITLILCGAPAVWAAEIPQFEREKVLARAGHAEELRPDFPLSPLGKETGRVFRQRYGVSGAAEYRLHFRVTEDLPGGGVSEIRILPAGGGE